MLFSYSEHVVHLKVKKFKQTLNIVYKWCKI